MYIARSIIVQYFLFYLNSLLIQNFDIYILNFILLAWCDSDSVIMI